MSKRKTWLWLNTFCHKKVVSHDHNQSIVLDISLVKLIVTAGVLWWLSMCWLDHLAQNLKAVMHRVQRIMLGGWQLDLSELTVASINLVIWLMAAAKEKRGLQTDSKIHYPNHYAVAGSKNSIQSVEYFLHSRIGNTDIPLSNVTYPQEVDPQSAPDECIRPLWAMSSKAL